MTADDRDESHDDATASAAARGKHRRTHARSAADPATPGTELIQLARRYPWTRSLIAGNHAAPAQLLAVLADGGDARVRFEVASNPSTPEHVLSRLATDSAAEVVDAARRHRAARSNPRYPEVARWTLAEQLATSVDPAADPRALDVLSHWPRRVRIDVARNPATAPETLRRLATDAKASVRAVVAAHRATPVGVLARFADDPDRFVRREVAARKDTPADVLTQLATDVHASVRSAAAANSHTPAEAVTELLSDGDADVRRRVAARKRLPSDAIRQLAEDADPRVRSAVAKNPSCPVPVLTALCEDTDPRVRERAQGRMKMRESPRQRIA